MTLLSVTLQTLPFIPISSSFPPLVRPTIGSASLDLTYASTILHIGSHHIASAHLRADQSGIRIKPRLITLRRDAPNSLRTSLPDGIRVFSQRECQDHQLVVEVISAGLVGWIHYYHYRPAGHQCWTRKSLDPRLRFET